MKEATDFEIRAYAIEKSRHIQEFRGGVTAADVVKEAAVIEKYLREGGEQPPSA